MRHAPLLALLFLALPGLGHAGCYGTGSFRSCTDASGNHYTINQLGNTTLMQGYSSSTGNSWNQTTNRIGNSSFSHGHAADGSSWSSSSHNLGGGYRSIQGQDSRGHRFNALCGPMGCN